MKIALVTVGSRGPGRNMARFTLPGFSAYASMKGAIETDFGSGTVRDNEQVNQFVASQTALGRVGQPEDIGGVAASLLTEDNRWVNAQRIEVSGGMFL